MTPDKPRSQKKAGSVARVGGSRKHFVQKPQGRSGPVTRIASLTMTVTYETDANGNPVRIVE